MAAVTEERRHTKPASRFSTAADFRRVVDEALTQLDSDDLWGPRFRATGISVRFELPDIASELDLAAAEDGSHNIRWSYEERDWSPKLRFRMDSDVANGFLQGRESLAVAVVRGRVEVSGEPRSALVYLPALKLLVEPYRQAIRHQLPGLALD